MAQQEDVLKNWYRTVKNTVLFSRPAKFMTDSLQSMTTDKWV